MTGIFMGTAATGSVAHTNHYYKQMEVSAQLNKTHVRCYSLCPFEATAE